MSGVKLGRPNPKVMEDGYQWQEIQKNKSQGASSFGDAVFAAIAFCVILLVLAAALQSIKVSPI